MVAGLGLLVAVAATILMELRGPVRGIWMSPAVGIAIGLIAGAGALAGLYPRLEPYAPRLARASTGLAVVTLALALVASVDGVVAASRGKLPANIALVAFTLAILGFVGAGAVNALVAWRTLALPRAVAGGLALAIALTLLAPVAMVTAGAIPVLLLVAVQAAWGLALLQLGRAIPPRNETTDADART